MEVFSNILQIKRCSDRWQYVEQKGILNVLPERAIYMSHGDMLVSVECLFRLTEKW